MKRIRILITGKNSYVGKNFESWLGNYPHRYSVNSISLRNDNWKEEDFSEYDVVIHVAGIAHIRETKENTHLYYKVNRDLTYEVAQKAKKQGVKQFIFLSTMSVYGIEIGVIDKDSPLNPKGNYGKSKLQAEELITKLDNPLFKVAIIRPPMIYGKECKGNYTKLAQLAVKLPIFPDIENKRSMIYIDNLCEFVKVIINNNSSGIFFPQNSEFICTSEMVKLIAEVHGKKIWMTKLFNPLIRNLNITIVNKIFGSLVYKKSISKFKDNYYVEEFKSSIYLTERKEGK